MAQGFTTYIDEVPDPNIVDLQAILASLTGTQKLALLNSFAISDNHYHVDRSLVPIHRDVIGMLFNNIALIRDYAIAYTRGEFGNTIPTTKTALTNAVKAITAHTYVFTLVELTAIINKMMLWSKKDINGDYVGTFTIFAANI